MRLSSFTVASGPAASSAVSVSILRRPSSPPAPLISSAASVWPFSEGSPRIAPGPDWTVMWPNFTGVSGMRPLAVSCAAASPATARSPPTPSVAPPSVTPSPARKSRRPRSLVISSSCRRSGDEAADRGNHGSGRFLHQPVARAADHLAADVGRDELGLLDEEGAARLLARQDQHRHGKPRAAQAGEVLRVTLEITEVLEARPHGPGLGVGPSVEPAIGLGHGALP